MNEASASVFFDSISVGGTLTLSKKVEPAPPSGFSVGGEPLIFDISTEAQIEGKIHICIPFDPTKQDDPTAVRLFHFESGYWKDITTNVYGERVCGETTSLSPFGVFAPTGELAIVSIQDQTVIRGQQTELTIETTGAESPPA